MTKQQQQRQRRWFIFCSYRNVNERIYAGRRYVLYANDNTYIGPNDIQRHCAYSMTEENNTTTIRLFQVDRTQLNRQCTYETGPTQMPSDMRACEESGQVWIQQTVVGRHFAATKYMYSVL